MVTGHVFLIGFMCAGKSTVGRALAPSLNLPFIDIDREAEKRVGPLLPFIQREGEEAFRKVESEVLQALLQGPVHVVATGGGTPCEEGNVELMKDAGAVVWLDTPLETLMPRIERAGGDRPLLFGLKGDPLRRRVEELLEERLPIYSRAEIAVLADVPAAEVAQRIMEALRLR